MLVKNFDHFRFWEFFKSHQNIYSVAFLDWSNTFSFVFAFIQTCVPFLVEL